MYIALLWTMQYLDSITSIYDSAMINILYYVVYLRFLYPLKKIEWILHNNDDVKYEIEIGGKSQAKFASM